ncbi:unnamed protein product [Fraxinus pennsylvanica]|uniref:Uncharacterized protein n=1 Tax=Fraxinus pennsylvanica TaxID=56036 RepID=A0AAD2ECI4_9LAMI|nr:unnamed protein product [Fraxinus pennsylvanica]
MSSEGVGSTVTHHRDFDLNKPALLEFGRALAPVKTKSRVPTLLKDRGKVSEVVTYNTFYSQLEEHMNQVGVDPSINRWDVPVALGMVDSHDALSHPAGVSDVQAESATHLDPDQYNKFLVLME